MKKTLKRTLATFLTVIMLFSALPLAGINLKANALASSGKCGDNVYWNFDSTTGTLTISGTGKMYDWGYEDILFDVYEFDVNKSIKKAIIKKGVTSIGNCAFSDCTSLSSITIPDSVTSIGDSAFDGCSSLASIKIPDSVTSIGEGAFSYCANLTSITVDKNNPVYDSRENCNAIIESATNTLIFGCQNTIISDGVAKIGEGAFEWCTSLTSITIPDSATSIGDFAFFSAKALKA